MLALSLHVSTIFSGYDQNNALQNGLSRQLFFSWAQNGGFLFGAGLSESNHRAKGSFDLETCVTKILRMLYQNNDWPSEFYLKKRIPLVAASLLSSIPHTQQERTILGP